MDEQDFEYEFECELNKFAEFDEFKYEFECEIEEFDEFDRKFK